MTDKKNREDKQGENAQQHYNNQALLAAFPFTAQQGVSVSIRSIW